MILPNVSTRNYIWTFTSNAVKTGNLGDIGARDRYLNPYIAESYSRIGLTRIINFPGGGVLDFFLKIYITHQAWTTPTPGEAHRVQFIGGFGINGYDSGTISGWKDDITVRLEIYDVDYTINGCYQHWEFSCSLIKLYIDGVLVHTQSSPPTVAGESYTPDLNYTSCESSVKDDIFIAPPYTLRRCCRQIWPSGYDCDPFSIGCNSYPLPEFDIRFTCYLTTDVEWVSIVGVTTIIPELQLYTFALQTPTPDPDCISSCDCTADLPTVSIMGHTMRTQSKLDFFQSRIFDSIIYCNPSTLQPGGIWYRTDYHGYAGLGSHKYSRSQIFGVDKNSSYCTDSHKLSSAYCNCSPDLDTYPFPPDNVYPQVELVSQGTDALAYSSSFSEVSSNAISQLCYCSGNMVAADLSVGCPPDMYDSICLYKVREELYWLTPRCGVTNDGYCDATHKFSSNRYYYAYTKAGNIYVDKSIFSVPFNISPVQVTSSGTSSEPTLCIATNDVLWLVYNTGTTTVYRRSTDHGYTWSGETTLFTGNPKFARIATSVNGTILFAAFKYITGSSGPGKIYVISYGPGDSSLPTAVVAKNESGSDIEVEDTQFDISYSNDQNGRWLLFCKRSGDTDLSHFASADHGITWRKIF